MTWPTPILVTKSPRPTELSNLYSTSTTVSFDARTTEELDKGHSECVLLALVVGLGGVLEEASVLDGYSLADLGLWAGALLVSSLGDAHVEQCLQNSNR